MADVTVSQFAEVLKVPVDRLIVQLDQAGIKVVGPDDRISDEAKLELLTHLRKAHGSETRAARPARSPQAQDPERTEAGEHSGACAHGQCRGAAQPHLHQARRARGAGTRAPGGRRPEAARGRGSGGARSERRKPSGGNASAWRPRTAAASRRNRTARRRRRRPAGPPSSRRAKTPSAASASSSVTFRRSPAKAAKPAPKPAPAAAPKVAAAPHRPEAPQRPSPRRRPSRTARSRRATAATSCTSPAMSAALQEEAARQSTPDAPAPTHAMDSRCPRRRMKHEVVLGETMTVAELAQKMAVKATEVIKV